MIMTMIREEMKRDGWQCSWHPRPLLKMTQPYTSVIMMVMKMAMVMWGGDGDDDGDENGEVDGEDGGNEKPRVADFPAKLTCREQKLNLAPLAALTVFV